MKKTLSVLAAFGFVLGMSGMAMAATASGAMTTSATLENGCTVSAATMTFPGFAALSSTADQTADTSRIAAGRLHHRGRADDLVRFDSGT
jgi:spore coat protein U-like protein